MSSTASWKLSIAAAASVMASSASAQSVQDRRIGYALTHKHWAVYETPGGKVECPQGFNEGPREQFKKLYGDGKQRSIVDAQLKREGEQWHPTTAPEAFRFLQAQGKVSYGLNLDGKVGPEDFDSPAGEHGIDNQLYRVIGCIATYRAGGAFSHFENLFMRTFDDGRVVIELTDVDDLRNDSDVTVTTYRGSNSLLQDATGEGFIPGGTQRVDLRWGKHYVSRLKGKIVDGVLTTQPSDRVMLPWGSAFDTSGYHVFRGFQLKLQLTPESAEGLMAGYVDVNNFNHHVNTSWSTHHHSYGQLSSPSQYKALSRLADGYPDPKSGSNTAISSAVTVKFTQVYVQQPDGKELLSRK